MANEGLETPSAADVIAQLWRTSTVDLESRRQLLARALAAGRPAGMKSWADDSEQDTGYCNFEQDAQRMSIFRLQPP